MIYQNWRAQHRCVDCGKVDDRTLDGHACCEPCAAKRRERRYQQIRRDPAKYAADLQSRKVYYQRLRDHHLCVRCGQSDERTKSGRSLCTACAAKNRKQCAIQRAKRKGAAQ